MTAGVPGTGIGGLFYLLAALLLPLRGIVRRIRGRRVSWRAIARNAGLAFGVFLGIWLTGWLLGLLVGPATETLRVSARGVRMSITRRENIVRWAALVGGFVTLFFVLLTVQVARFTVKRR
jgi:MFS family permease